MSKCNENSECEIFFDFSANIETWKIDLKPNNPNCEKCSGYNECVSRFFGDVEDSVWRVLNNLN